MDASASGERIIAHLAFARAVAARSLDPRCRGADREDLIAWGVVGLVQAAQRYRGDLGASFGAYAARRVRGQVLDALRDRDPLTRSPAPPGARTAKRGGSRKTFRPPTSRSRSTGWLSSATAGSLRPMRSSPKGPTPIRAGTESRASSAPLRSWSAA